ncbi:MAG: 1,4-dihydroxy-2-naphthoate polyprenyltransferase [Actinomycetes bacterium]
MKKWLLGARPRTLPAAIAPVLVGTSLQRNQHGSLAIVNALLALAVSLLLQIAVNYANDYSDGVKGTDEVRVGPIRLVASGMASAQSVKRAAYLAFLLASIFGAVLALRTSLWLIAVGIIAIIAAWNYTGGKSPYGYSGLGEVSVFIFFGLVATMGSYFAQSQKISWQSFLLAIPVGALACALLAINNLRDLPKDALVGKRTVAVRIGDANARYLFIGLLALAHFTVLLAATITPWVLLSVVLIPFTIKISGKIMAGSAGRDLIPLLGKTARLQLLLSTTLALALWL